MQENRAREVIAGEKAARSPRFVKINNGTKTLDEASLARARRLAGLKGYVTNIPASLMPVDAFVASIRSTEPVAEESDPAASSVAMAATGDGHAGGCG